jgi:hypothetical protein
MEQVTIILEPAQAKIWVMAQFLASVGVFDIKCGRVIIDFDREGLIGNVKVVHNYKPPKMATKE